jgi:hypothetical protein
MLNVGAFVTGRTSFFLAIEWGPKFGFERFDAFFTHYISVGRSALFQAFCFGQVDIAIAPTS